MARKNANSTPRVWLGLLLVLVGHTLAKSARIEEGPESKGFPENEEIDYDITIPGKVGSPPKLWDLDDPSSIPNKLRKPMKEEAKDLNNEKRKDEHSANATELDDKNVASLNEKSEEANVDVITTTTTTTTTEQTRPDHFTPRENEPIPTITTIDLEQRSTINVGAGTTESTKATSEVERLVAEVNETHDTTIERIQSVNDHNSDGKPSTSDYQEFSIAEEHDNFEEHTVSELAEGTTQSSHHDVGNGVTISLANDIDVNNGTSISFDHNGVSSGHEPKHQVERFNVTDLSSFKTSEQTGRGMMDGNTTPYYSSSSRPKGRTISNTGDNDLSTKKPSSLNYSDSDQSTSGTIRRIVPKKPTSTGKPYPYLHSESNVTVLEAVTERPNSTEGSTDGISAYENIIGKQTSVENIVEPSVLGENSIQQFKPIHNKRSGNSSRVNSTLDTHVASTAWSLATTKDFWLKNTTEVTEESHTISPDNGNRSHINNDVPQDNPNKSFTTIRSPVILSEVPENNIETGIGSINSTYNLNASTPISKKLIERSKVTAEDIPFDTQVSNSTEKIETVSNGSSTSNEIQSGNDDSSITLNQLNVTKGSAEFVLPENNLSTSTEISTASGSNTTEKLNLDAVAAVTSATFPTDTEAVQESSTPLPTSESADTKLIEETETDITELETEPTTTQTTNVEYEFIELTTPGSNTTVSQDDVASSEKSNATTDFLNVTAQTTESQDIPTTDVSVEQNETMVSGKIGTTDPETPAVSTTLIFETTTTSNNNTETTTADEEVSNTTNSPVPESSFITVTDVFTDTTLPSTFSNDKSSHGRVGDTTDGQTTDAEETTTMIPTETVPPADETTTVSNIEVITSSESTSTPKTSTTATQTTTPQIQTTTELPEFIVSSEDVTLFVRVLIEGSWNDVCSVLNNLRQSLANLLTEGTGRTVRSRNIILHQTQCSADASSVTTLTQVVLYVVDDNGKFDYTMTELVPSLYKASPFEFTSPIHSVEKLVPTESTNNAIAVIAVSSVAFICLVLLAGLLFIMRKRQTRFNYGERCRPVSLDAFRLDSVSAYNSVRRKGLTRASKRSYGNPAFEDSSVTPTHPLNFAGLSSFCNETNAITEEFEGIPQVTARMDELPAGSEVKNRYANVAPLPETRVLLQKINNEPLTEYINASYVRGPKNATKYYIACQAPMESTVSDFWRMIWEQQSKVIIMLTDIVENGVEKCVEYIPPSEVTDCHRLYGDYQVTLKKREAKEKYAISTLHLKNLENNTYREVSHIWYLWPTNGVPSNGTGLIAILLEARALQRGAPGPIVIHCSPGTGRTGTLIALDLGIRQYEITRTVDVPRVVYTIRRDRAGAVQTKEQYAFIYKSLNLYAAKLAGGALESM